MCLHCFKLASDKARYEILSALKKNPKTVSELTEGLHVKQPTVTHHLKRLVSGGLITMTRKGRSHVYALATESECFTECGLLAGLKA